MKKRFLSMLLAVVMMFTIVDVTIPIAAVQNPLVCWRCNAHYNRNISAFQNHNCTVNLANFIAPIEVVNPYSPEYAGWIAISDRAGLEAMADNLNGKYYLTNDIDLDGKEWIPISNHNNPFTGTLDGQGYAIRNLTITGAKQLGEVGLFGTINSAIIKNVGMENTCIDVDLSGGYQSYYVGTICGDSFNSVVKNCYNTGNVSGTAEGSDDDITERLGGISSPVLRLQAILQFSQIVDILTLGDTAQETAAENMAYISELEEKVLELSPLEDENPLPLPKKSSNKSA